MVDKSNKKIMFKVMFVNVYLLNVRMFVANKVVVQVEFYLYHYLVGNKHPYIQQIHINEHYFEHNFLIAFINH